MTLAGFKYVEASVYKRFMEQIAAEPHNDTPRLVLCDWLEGDVDDADSRNHAKFIRTQFAVAEQHAKRGGYVEATLLATERHLFQILPLWTLYGRPKPKSVIINLAVIRRTSDPLPPNNRASVTPALLCRKGFFTELLCDGRWLLSGRWSKLRKKCPITDVWLADRDHPNLSERTETKLDDSVTLHHRFI